MGNSLKPNVRYIFVIRHGERADHVGLQPQHTVDPHLSPAGLDQASKTGQFIKQTLKEIEAREGEDFNSVNVRSSPFVRCIQTAAMICKSIDKDITTDYTYCERLGTDLFLDNPSEEL